MWWHCRWARLSVMLIRSSRVTLSLTQRIRVVGGGCNWLTDWVGDDQLLLLTTSPADWLLASFLQTSVSLSKVSSEASVSVIMLIVKYESYCTTFVHWSSNNCIWFNIIFFLIDLLYIDHINFTCNIKILCKTELLIESKLYMLVWCCVWCWV